MAGSRLVYDFTHNASARFRPPYWVKGEDSSFGFFVHISPFQTVRRLGIPLGHTTGAAAWPRTAHASTSSPRPSLYSRCR